MTRCVSPLSRRRFLFASASATLLSACAARPAAGPEIPAGSSPTLESLLAAEAVEIRKLTAGDPGVMALASRLAASRMAGLGEATHGSHEDALLKSVLIQAMVEHHDLRVLLLEANRAGTAQLDAYASGGPTGLLAAEALKEAQVLRILKTEVIADLLTWLRGWNAVNPDRRVSVLGVDCQASSQDAGDALAALADFDPAAAQTLSPALAPILSAEVKGLRHDLMVRQLTAAQRADAESACLMLGAELDRAGLSSAAFAARRAWQGLSAFAFETSDADMSLATPDYWSRRDVFMAENALALAADQRAVFWGHNLHVAGTRPGGEGSGYVPSGAILRERLGASYCVLTQEFASATFLAIPDTEGLAADAAQVQIKRRARPGTLNALLAKASPATAWFDLSVLQDHALVRTLRETPIGIDWYSASASLEPKETDISQLPPGDMFDLVVIHPELTPSRML